MPRGIYERTPEMKTGKYERKPENNAAMPEIITNSKAAKAAADAQRGVPKSPEHCDAMSEGSKNSEDVKAAAEKQRGGNDLVTHHYIYDESDLSLNTVQMTRSDHQKLHRLLQKLGYIIPHINGDNPKTLKVLQPKGL